MSSVTTSKRKFAAFDIDGTLYRNSLFLDVTEALIQKGIINEQAAIEHYEMKQKWHQRSHKESYEEFVTLAVNHTMKSLTGVKVSEIESISKEVCKSNHRFVYTYTRDLLDELKRQGYFLIAISGSLQEVVAEFTHYYPFDTFASTVWHRTEDGASYTGTYSHGGKDKHLHIQKLMSEHNLTLEGSIAVGDSIGDISMLEMVDRPIAFNPEQKLFAEAKQKNWKIVIERKNVIIELENRNGQFVLV